ncbi:hypothetical protein RSOLAG1IB_10183 [Rhizoctonia solani AG-1 IB]|uniref:Uncharacterized protein n=1 Tax=Thanatephorus cucumeris (strain AG1-IB / isolate 7/3/14) TaxID=1108050 RepID=A0A0B7FVY3_THACB|nr:hypothetical protein RSOLAG1IB_10183 [Rhizoctonia solani AG-1 IB]
MAKGTIESPERIRKPHGRQIRCRRSRDADNTKIPRSILLTRILADDIVVVQFNSQESYHVTGDHQPIYNSLSTRIYILYTYGNRSILY